MMMMMMEEEESQQPKEDEQAEGIERGWRMSILTHVIIQVGAIYGSTASTVQKYGVFIYNHIVLRKQIVPCDLILEPIKGNGKLTERLLSSIK
jgi:hypothetical protein